MKRIRTALVLPAALGLALSGTLLTAPAAQAGAGSSCVGYYKTAHDVRRNAFVGHRVVLDFKTCGYRRYSVPIGPVQPGIRGMSKPVLTLPTRVIFGGGETLKVITGVYHYSSTAYRFEYRFVLQQSHRATPYLTQNWKMSLQVRRTNTPIARICFVGRSCGAWQN